MKLFQQFRALYEAVMGQELKREVARNRSAADALDAAVREMLQR